MTNSNILSERYAGTEINSLFSEKGRILAERELWISVMKAQKKLGLNIPDEAIAKYEGAKENIDLLKIKEIEKTTKHDVKAKIEAFVEAAGAEEHIHKGMTSRDLTDNVDQLIVKKASKIIFGKYVSILKNLLEKSDEYKSIILTARTHHQPAQATLLGRRFSMWAEELRLGLTNLESTIEKYPLRGIKGPVGTQFDMLTLLKDKSKVDELESLIAQELEFNHILKSPGQVYPRSLDYNILSSLSNISSACENFAKGMRLMSGYELMTEGFKKGQVGSSAMPHKMNTRSSERICSLAELLKMYADGASRLSGDQWEEGDVSCSVIRRVILPDAFYTSDGLCETTLNVLSNMGAYPEVISKETDKYLPFLATTEILMTAINAGIGRETAHEIIKTYAVEEALKMKEGAYEPKLIEKLSEDPIFIKHNITKKDLENITSNKSHFIGNAYEQIAKVTEDSLPLLNKYSKEAEYKPGDIL